MGCLNLCLLECLILLRQISHYQFFLCCNSQEIYNIYPQLFSVCFFWWWATIVIVIFSATSLEVHGRNVFLYTHIYNLHPCLMYKNCNHVIFLFQIYIVYSKRTGKPRGYAFIEYEHERDMHCEYHLCSPVPVHFCTDSIDIGQSS